MIDLAIGISEFLVKPEGSKRVWVNLSTRSCSGTPCCSASEVMVAKLSIRPEIVEPSLAMVMKISPELPRFVIRVLDLLDRRVGRHVDRLRDRAADERLHGTHHLEMAHVMDRAR